MLVPKYPRTFHLPFSPEIHSDDKTHMNPGRFVGTRVVITEKIDGGNCSIHDGKIYARSTGQEATAAWFGLTKKHHAWKTIGVKNLIFYGEDFAAVHSCIYEPQKEDEFYKVFHILYNNHAFMSWDDVEEYAKAYNFQTVPVLFDGVFDSLADIEHWMVNEAKKQSAIGGEREGFVIRLADEIPYNDFGDMVAKYVRKGHCQTDQHWTRNWEWAEMK